MQTKLTTLSQSGLMALGFPLLSGSRPCNWLSNLLWHTLLPQIQTISQRVLTSEGRYKQVSIFDEVFYKPVGALQLYLMALQPLSELRTVQERITKLQRRQTHRQINTHSYNMQ